MMRTFLLALGLIVETTVLAAPTTAEIRVKGMVCDFCTTGVKKRLGSRDEVDKIDVNLTAMRITVTFKEGKQLPDETLREAVQQAGFAVESIERR